MRRLTPCTIIPPDLYVLRDADKQLRNVLKDMGRPAYVLVARQMGKTNLLLNAKRELEDQNNAFVYIDLSAPFATERECFRHIIDTALDTRADVFSACAVRILEARKGAPAPSYKEHENELQILLDAISGKLVIILDEIDSLTKTPFSDKIFAQVRRVYFTRTNYPRFNRLSYVLSGVAEPNELIKDKKISPFNIGEKIYLDDFTSEQFSDFLSRAQLTLDNEVTDRILYWANGNPRLTWDICFDLEEKLGSGYFITPDEVDNSVTKLYLTGFNRAPVDHIREVVAADDELRNAITVIKYGKGETLPDSTKNKLYLAGISRSARNHGSVKIKNKIIEAALSDQWLRDVSIKRKGLLRLANEHYAEHRYLEALTLYEQLVGSPDISEKEKESAYWDMGLCAYHAEEYKKALAYLNKAHWDKEATAALYYECEFYLGACHVQLGDTVEGRAHFEETLHAPKTNLTYFNALINLGQIHAKEKDFPGAIELYNSVLTSAESSALPSEMRAAVKPLAFYGLAKAYADAGQNEMSREYFKKALSSCAPKQGPAILLAMSQRALTGDERKQLITQSVDLVIGNNLHPDSLGSENSISFTPTVFYNLLRDAYAVDRSAFERLFAFAGRLDELKTSNTAILLKLAYLSASMRDYEGAARIAKDIVETPVQGLVKSVDAEFQSCRLLFLLTKGKGRSKYRSKYIEFLRSGYEPKSIDGIDLEVFVDLATCQIEGKKPREALETIALARQYRPLLAKEHAAEFAAIYFYEMLALRDAGLKAKLRLASEETLAFLELLPSEQIGANRLVNAEALKTIEGFARENLGQGLDLISQTLNIQHGRKYGRNERVSVRYADGSIKEDKFKRVEADLAQGKCTLVET